MGYVISVNFVDSFLALGHSPWNLTGSRNAILGGLSSLVNLSQLDKPPNDSKSARTGWVPLLVLTGKPKGAKNAVVGGLEPHRVKYPVARPRDFHG